MEKQFDAIMSMNDEAKIAYLKAFTHLASIDGKFDDSEKAYIKSLAEQYLVPAEKMNEIFKIESDDAIIKAVSSIKNRRASLELMNSVMKKPCLSDV